MCQFKCFTLIFFLILLFLLHSNVKLPNVHEEYVVMHFDKDEGIPCTVGVKTFPLAIHCPSIEPLVAVGRSVASGGLIQIFTYLTANSLFVIHLIYCCGILENSANVLGATKIRNIILQLSVSSIQRLIFVHCHEILVLQLFLIQQGLL